MLATSGQAWVNRLKWLQDHWDSSRLATPQRASREKRSEQLKSYCKGLRIDGALISKAYESWLDAPAGKKNAWRVPDVHGSAAALMAEIEGEIASRAQTLSRARRVCSYWGWFKNTDSLGLIMSNGFDRTFKQAKRRVSVAGRSRHELPDNIGNPAGGSAD